MSIEIMYLAQGDLTALYHRYPGQLHAQPVYVELDPEQKRLSIYWDTEIGTATPEPVYHGRKVRWEISPLLPDVANALLTEIAPLAERVIAGYKSTWNGSNTIGVYNKDARNAGEAITALCEEAERDGYYSVRVWEAADWFESLGGTADQAAELGITAETTDSQLAEIAEREEQAFAADDQGHVLEGLAGYLASLREAVRQ